MRRGRIWIYLILVIVIVVGAAFIFLGQNFISTVQSTPTPEVRYVSVIVVAQSVQRGDQITEEMLGTIELPEDKLVDVMITDPALVVGKLAKYPLEPGVPVTSAVLVDDASQLAQGGSEAAKLVPPGMTAITIPITRLSSVGYGLRDGDRVDVIATMLFIDVDPSFQSVLPNVTYTTSGTGFLPETLPYLTTTVLPLCSAANPPALCNESNGLQGRVELDATLNQAFYVAPRTTQRPRLVAQRILQNVQVLKIGSFTLPGADKTVQPGQPTPTPDPAAATAPVKVERPDIITLIVNPQDAVTLTYLMYSNAQLTLTLRGVEDQSRVDTEAATLQFLLSQYAIPVPAKLPYSVEPAVEQLIQPFLPNDIVTTTEE